MIIQHNISALNAHRTMGANNNSTSKNLEKLSSGYKINRAGDDAAGLAISEKMRGQIRGLSMAEQNVSNGINLIQTAEGGLNETHAILQRMRELAVSSSNGTFDEGVDRAQLDKEFQTIKSEIDRIASSTHYNGIKLLDGSLSGGGKAAVAKFGLPDSLDKVTTLTDPVAATKGTTTVTITAGNVTGTASKAYSANFEIAYNDASGKSQTVNISITDDGTTDRDFSQIGTVDSALKLALQDSELGAMFDITTDGSGKVTFTAKEAGNNEVLVTGIRTKLIDKGAGVDSTATFKTETTASKAGADSYQTLDLTKFSSTDAAKNKFSINGVDFQLVSSQTGLESLDKGVVGIIAAGGAPTAAEATAAISLIKQHTGLDVRENNATANGKLNIYGATSGASGAGLTFQIGANGGADQRVSLSVDNMSSGGLGIKSLSIATIDGANAAIEKITTATNMVSSTRADLGALQNRLEHTQNNLGVTKENLTAAESTIRDVDMAKEMMDFTKNQILVQASQAMLAQANQLPQGVLQLLR